jgi:hypothetical protein
MNPVCVICGNVWEFSSPELVLQRSMLNFYHDEDVQEMEKAASKYGDHRRRNGGYFAYRSHDLTRFISLNGPGTHNVSSHGFVFFITFYLPY